MALPADDVAGPGPDAVRHDVLELTSRLREDLQVLGTYPPDPTLFDGVLQTGRNLTRALVRSRLELLVDGGEALEQMAGLAKTLVAEQPDAAGAIVAGLGRAVGVLEQSLDAVLEEAGGERLESLGEALLGSFPEPWSSYLDEPATASEAGEPAAPRRSRRKVDPAAPESDEDLLDAFETETADTLTRCEELVLRGEQDGFTPDLVAALDRDLETIQDATGATDLSDAARILESGREVLAAASEPSISFAWLVETLFGVIDGARAIVEHSCGLGSDAHFSGEALWVELRARLNEPRDDVFSGDPGTMPYERVFRRIRVALRSQARIHVESTPADLGIARAVEARIEGALLHMLRAAFEDVAADEAGEPFTRIRVETERIGDSTLVVTMEDDETAAEDDVPVDRDAGDNGGAPTKPETLHWIDVTKELADPDLERLRYRPGFCNVVQILVPPKALRQNAASGAAP